MNADRIEKTILLRAPLKRVWRALADSEAQRPHEGTPFEIMIEKIEPEWLFSFRWHPGAVGRDVGYSLEPATLVTVTESGFDKIPLARRAKAFTANEQGWGMVMQLIAKRLSDAA